MLQAFADGGIVGFPNDALGVDVGEIDVAGAQGDFELMVGKRADVVDAAALFVLLGVAFVEDDAVARFQWGVLRLES